MIPVATAASLDAIGLWNVRVYNHHARAGTWVIHNSRMRQLYRIGSNTLTMDEYTYSRLINYWSEGETECTIRDGSISHSDSLPSDWGITIKSNLISVVVHDSSTTNLGVCLVFSHILQRNPQRDITLCGLKTYQTCCLVRNPRCELQCARFCL